jgi:hypothetical protein
MTPSRTVNIGDSFAESVKTFLIGKYRSFSQRQENDMERAIKQDLIVHHWLQKRMHRRTTKYGTTYAGFAEVAGQESKENALPV